MLFCLLNSCGTNEQKNIAWPDKINTSIWTPTHRILKNLEEVWIDPTPEMNISEIMSVSNKELIKLVSKVEQKREKYFNHKDENWSYAIINGKKVYHCDNNHA